MNCVHTEEGIWNAFPHTGPRLTQSHGLVKWKPNNLVNGNGTPLSIVVSATNIHDSKNLLQVLEERVVSDDSDCETDVNFPHIRPRGEEKQELEKIRLLRPTLGHGTF